MDFWYFKVETDLGRFYSTIEAEGPMKAEELTRAFFGIMAGMEIKELTSLGRESYNSESRVTIFHDSPPYAGRDIWNALGMREEYVNQMRIMWEEYGFLGARG